MEMIEDTNSIEDKKREVANAILTLLDTEDKASIVEIYEQYAIELWMYNKLNDMIDSDLYNYEIQLKLEMYGKNHRKRYKRLLKILKYHCFVPYQNTMFNYNKIKFQHNKMKLNYNYTYHHEDNIHNYNLMKSISKVRFIEEINIYYKPTIFSSGL